MKKILLGNEAIVQGALEAGVDFVSTYPGTPSSEIGNIFSKIAKNNGIYFEFSTNEKTALEAAIGASFCSKKCLVAMKSFGLNVCSDSLLPLCYTGTKGPMVIIVGDDPSCWSSAQSEQNSRAYAYLSHIPIIEPSDPEECKEFTKLAFEISEKFNLPVIVRTTTRVAHQRMPVKVSENRKQKIENGKEGIFIKDTKRFVTMPPRVLEMKKELLEKIEKIRNFEEKSPFNKVCGDTISAKAKLGIITSGVSYLHVLEAMEKLGLKLPILKLGFFYPLPEKKIKNFIKNLKKVLVVEELDPYLEKEIKILAREANQKIYISGKDLLPEIGELNPDKLAFALAKFAEEKYNPVKTISLDLPKRTPKPCQGCPYWYVFSAVKKIAPSNTVFGGDIGCYMLAGMPPFEIQDYLFSMGSGVGIGHGIKKVSSQKLIAFMGDSTFFHSGIPALVNSVYNKSDILLIILDNRITAMTGHQPNPGMGQTGSGEIVEQIKIEEVIAACGVKNIKVVDSVKVQELQSAIKELLDKSGTSVLVARHICALLEKRQKKNAK